MFSGEEKQKGIENVLRLSSIFSKIRTKDNQNQEQDKEYKRVLAVKIKKKTVGSSPNKQKKLKLYDERKYNPEDLLKIEAEENEIPQVKDNVLSRMTRDKQGEILNREEIFFKIYKYDTQLRHKHENSRLMDPSVKFFLLEKCFYYLAKGNKYYKKDMVKGFQYYLMSFKILQEIGLEWMFLEFIKHEKKDSAKCSFSYLIEAKIYAENGCVEEYSENIFNYLSKSFNISSPEEKVIILFIS